MKKILLLLKFIIVFSFSSSFAQTPTCSSPIGKWHNELGSTLIIKKIDGPTGAISREYISPSGGGSSSFELTGSINGYVGPNCQRDNYSKVKTISFFVNWGKLGSITSWVGTIVVNKNNESVMKTMWNLARPVGKFPWDHILNGSDTFFPGPPPLKK